jgi:hypothetical protein
MIKLNFWYILSYFYQILIINKLNLLFLNNKSSLILRCLNGLIINVEYKSNNVTFATYK